MPLNEDERATMRKLLEHLKNTDKDKKSPKRFVSDEEYAAAWANTDNKNLAACELQKYSLQLSKEDLESIGLNAMWRALQYHRDDMGQKFTTSLWTFIHWECDKEVKKQKKLNERERRSSQSLHEIPEADLFSSAMKRSKVGDRERRDRLSHVKECMTFLPKRLRIVIQQHYFENRTLEEISDVNKYSKETARKRLATARSQLKEFCQDPQDAAGVLS